MIAFCATCGADSGGSKPAAERRAEVLVARARGARVQQHLVLAVVDPRVVAARIGAAAHVVDGRSCPWRRRPLACRRCRRRLPDPRWRCLQLPRKACRRRAPDAVCVFMFCSSSGFFGQNRGSRRHAQKPEPNPPKCVLSNRTTFYYCAAQVGKSTKSHTRSRHPTRTLFDRLIVTARKSLGRMFEQRMERK